MSDNDKVICPHCCHEFAAIPVNVQARLAKYEQAELPEPEPGFLENMRGCCERCDKQLAYIDALRAHAARVTVERDEAKEAQERAERTKHDEGNQWRGEFVYLSNVLQERSERLYAEKLECHAEWCRAEAAERRADENARDAERYRMLRLHTAPLELANHMCVDCPHIPSNETIIERVDSMVDAAIAARSEEAT